jgi:Icc-related predicted phosphoesterase
MIIDSISDLHGSYPKLEGGDLLIVAGDLTASDLAVQYFEFEDWLVEQPYRKKIVIGGNHDNFLVDNGRTMFAGGDYLKDSGTEFEGLKIWGSPWTALFKGVNPYCTAFMVQEESLANQWVLIPDDTDILITHTPPFGTLDKARQSFRVGSPSLEKRILQLNLKLHVFGHIHYSYGTTGVLRKSVNCSHMNESYEPINPPIRIEL